MKKNLVVGFVSSVALVGIAIAGGVMFKQLLLIVQVLI